MWISIKHSIGQKEKERKKLKCIFHRVIDWSKEKRNIIKYPKTFCYNFNIVHSIFDRGHYIKRKKMIKKMIFSMLFSFDFDADGSIKLTKINSTSIFLPFRMKIMKKIQIITWHVGKWNKFLYIKKNWWKLLTPPLHTLPM